MQRPTIKTIALETGLSIATVSKALKHSPQVRPETRAIVTAAAERVGYELNMHGVQLRTGKTYQVAAIMTAPGPKQNEWEGVEYAQLLSGISWALEDSPYRVSLYAVRNFEESLATIRQLVSLKKADGIIVSGTRADDPRVRIMQEADFPFVTYGTTIHNAPHAYVDADNEQMIRLSVARLAERGHRRIALINPVAELSYAITRLNAYRRALETAGLTFDPALVAHGPLTPAFGRENVLAMSDVADPPTAYICANEASALGAFSGFHAPRPGAWPRRGHQRDGRPQRQPVFRPAHHHLFPADPRAERAARQLHPAPHGRRAARSAPDPDHAHTDRTFRRPAGGKGIGS